jgi:hypothetical protein
MAFSLIRLFTVLAGLLRLSALREAEGHQAPERDALFGWVLWLKDAGSVPAALLDGNGDGNLEPVR